MVRIVGCCLAVIISFCVHATEGDTTFTRLFPVQRWAEINAATTTYLRLDTLDRGAIAQLGDLTQIRALSVQGHKLQAVPDVVCQLQTLTHLDLSHNQLTTLPAGLSKLQGLQEIWLGHNPGLDMGQAIDVLAQLPLLRALHVEADNITVVPASIARLKQLQVLDLSGNRFAQLPPELGQLTQLNTLWLNDEPAQFSLEQNIGVLRHLPNLRELHIEGDHLSQLPKGLFRLPALERVYAGNNPVLRLPGRHELRHSHLRLLDVQNAPLPPTEIHRVQQTAPGIRLRF